MSAQTGKEKDKRSNKKHIEQMAGRGRERESHRCTRWVKFVGMESLG
jgi:hypothetical protein